MHRNRRSVLRDLGTLGAISTLPSLLPALVGCKQTQPDQPLTSPPFTRAKLPASGKPNTLRILLEGPWIIHRPGTTSSFLEAVAVMDSQHKCHCGLWDDGQKKLVDPVSGKGDAMQLVGPQNWAATVQNLNAGNTFQATLDALKHSLSCIQDGTVAPALATDIVFNLPFPDYCILAGKYKTGHAAHPGRPDFIPHTTAVLGYSESAGKALRLAFPDPASPLHKIDLTSGNDLVFRLVHTHCTPSPAEDTKHVVAMFAEAMKRISPTPNRILALSDVDNDRTPADNGVLIGPEELGLPGSTATPCVAFPASQGNTKSTTFANCVGGVMGVGP